MSARLAPQMPPMTRTSPDRSARGKLVIFPGLDHRRKSVRAKQALTSEQLKLVRAAG